MEQNTNTSETTTTSEQTATPLRGESRNTNVTFKLKALPRQLMLRPGLSEESVKELGRHAYEVVGGGFEMESSVDSSSLLEAGNGIIGKVVTVIKESTTEAVQKGLFDCSTDEFNESMRRMDILMGKLPEWAKNFRHAWAETSTLVHDQMRSNATVSVEIAAKHQERDITIAKGQAAVAEAKKTA